MRIWDISPGYLNRQSLLGEHRELHGLYNVAVEHKQGYSRHPETLRWVDCISGLVCRHAQLAAEMELRGYTDRTPLSLTGEIRWPRQFVTEPWEQFQRLAEKYRDKPQGRIPLPRNAQELWAQHKYSVMARDPQAYRRFGRLVAKLHKRECAASLAEELTLYLRQTPAAGRLAAALQHMWGHVKDDAGGCEREMAKQGGAVLLALVQSLAKAHNEPYLLSSTALSELAVYV